MMKARTINKISGDSRKEILEIKPRSLHCFPKDYPAAIKILNKGKITMAKEEQKTVSSVGDDRVVNNVMRHAYKVLNNEEKAAMQKIKDDALALHTFLDSLGESRELSIAKTKIEESVFWAVKHVTG